MKIHSLSYMLVSIHMFTSVNSLKSTLPIEDFLFCYSSSSASKQKEKKKKHFYGQMNFIRKPLSFAPRFDQDASQGWMGSFSHRQSLWKGRRLRGERLQVKLNTTSLPPSFTYLRRWFILMKSTLITSQWVIKDDTLGSLPLYLFTQKVTQQKLRMYLLK